jgi:hypothetical protein
MAEYHNLKKMMISCCESKKFKEQDQLCKDLQLLTELRNLPSKFEDDIPILLPRVLTLACLENKNIRLAVIPCLPIFKELVLKNPAFKNSTWWNQMECNIIPK